MIETHSPVGGCSAESCNFRVLAGEDKRTSFYSTILFVLAPWKKSYDEHRQHIKKKRHCFAHKGLSSQSYGFSSSRVWLWELDYKEAEHWRIDAFELWCWKRLLRVPWTARRFNQSILKKRTDAEAEVPILWPPDVKSWVIRKDSDLEKTEGRRRRGWQR